MTKKQTSQTPWYSEEYGFFGPGYLKEYEAILPQEKTLAEVDFLEKMLALQKGVKILDCPCGHGRHSVELARRGYDVTGQDLNGFFIEEAKKAAAQAGVSVRWNKGDMRELPFENEFDHTTGRNNEKRTRIDVNGKREEFSLPLRMYTVAELVKMFRKAGLTLKETYGNYSGEPLTFDTKRFILVAEKE